MLPRVAIASLGGTITMLASGPEGGVAPTLDAGQLLGATPELASIARLEATTLATMPGASLRCSDVLRAVDWARAAVHRGAAGAVLVQGTDTMEETVYLADLAWDLDEPLIFTGAMRSPRSPGADGPANLLAAVRTAGSPAARGLGAVLVMNDEVHAAARVRKTATSSLQTFASPNFGPIGRVDEGRVVIGNRPGRWPTRGRSAGTGEPRVVLLETFLGDDGGLLGLAADAGCDGAVVAATGVGHVSSDLAERIAAVAATTPVILASRTGSGTTFRATYGFPGSERDLLSRGAIAAGWLDPRKARLLLWWLLAHGCSRAEIVQEFALRGGHPGGPAPDHTTL